MKIITTSWDDGHVLDFKLARLLQKYNLPATFYIPKTNAERPVMTTSEIKSLAADFEIGGHGLQHLRLNGLKPSVADSEIRGSFDWITVVTGYPPPSFCFPGGAYNYVNTQSVFSAGYKLARTTELFSTGNFIRGHVSATTMQAYPHSRATYVKHLLKRRRGKSLLSWLQNNSKTDLVALAENWLKKISEEGGCFHLWGHSWEIEEQQLWPKIELLFSVIANRGEFMYVPNKGLITL